ncbi:hypothetical protein ACHAXR_011820 [Thalassiosira sp. AJA248-18]
MAFVDSLRFHRRNVIHVGPPAVRLFEMDGLVESMNFGSANICQLYQPPLSLPHTMEASSSFVALSTTMNQAILSTISYAVTSFATLLLPIAGQLQRAGETLLAAFLLLSFIQAFVALYQYRYDARGQLVFPDGLTLGKEDYYSGDHTVDATDTTGDDGNDKQDKEQTLSPNITDTQSTAITIDNMNSSWATQLVKKLNKSLVLLLPWITRNVHNLLTKNTHLFHIGFIVFILDSILPLISDGDTNAMAADGERILGDGKMDKNASSVKIDFGTLSLLQKMKSRDVLSPSSRRQNPIRVLVIGDSLSIGIGCIEQFDATKDNSAPMALVENTAMSRPPKTPLHTRQGPVPPVFPQILARTLSYHFQQPVQWRSAGVDGGDVNDIRSFCMDVVKQECQCPKSDATLDIVVVLFGMNDLKKVLSVNPIQHLFRGRESEDRGGTSHFRHGMEMLLSDIRSHAPGALVVFPALPIQTFHKNSIINIFPLGFIVDTVMGGWERQKKIVASSRSNAMYVELKAKEIADWYSSSNNKSGNTPPNSLVGDNDISIVDDFEDTKDGVLLSADGVHPNKLMYAKWAELVGHKLYKHIVPQLDLVDQNHIGLLKETRVHH